MIKSLKVTFNRKISIPTLNRVRILGSKYFKEVPEITEVFVKFGINIVHPYFSAKPDEKTGNNITDYLFVVHVNPTSTQEQYNELLKTLQECQYIEKVEEQFEFRPPRIGSSGYYIT